MNSKLSVLFLLTCLILNIQSGSISQEERSSRRLHLPLLGLGPYCTGCPTHFCDDDPAIIHGYCCGCAAVYDTLPIQCSMHLNCPLNASGLCHDYEYMMHCCCE